MYDVTQAVLPALRSQTQGFSNRVAPLLILVLKNQKWLIGQNTEQYKTEPALFFLIGEGVCFTCLKSVVCF